MAATWKQLSFTPSTEALSRLRESWGWLVPESMSPVMCAIAGDVFFEATDKSIHWLDTGQGSLTRIAESQADFLDALRSDGGAEWLLAPLMDSLLAAGKFPESGQCFAYKTMPVLGGSYSVENMALVSASSWYGFSGYLHAQIKDLPEGAHVEFRFDEI